MPKNSSTCDPTTREASNRKKLLIATRPARALRSASVRNRVRPRKSGALPTGLMMGNRVAKQSRNVLAKLFIRDPVRALSD